MKFFKRISAVAISMIMMCSIAEMNVFAVSTVQDGLEVSLTTDKEIYSKNEKITATLSVKNTNTADVTDVSMETAIPDGYKVDNGLSNVKILETLVPNETAELKVVYVSDYMDEGGSNDSEKQDSEISQNSKEEQINQRSQDNEIGKYSSVVQESKIENKDKSGTINTGDNTRTIIIISLMLVSIIIGIFCLKNKKGKMFLSVVICVCTVSAVVSIIPFGTNAVQNNSSKYVIALNKNLKFSNNDVILNSLVKYKTPNTQTEGNCIEEQLDNTLSCFVQSKFDDSFKYVDMYGNIKNEFTMNDIPRLVAKNISYEISNIDILKDSNGDDVAFIDIKFITVDMMKLLSNIEQSNNYRSIIVDKLESREYATKELDVRVFMMKIDEQWYLYETAAFDDVLTGGMYSVDMAVKSKYLENIFEGGKAS